MMIGINNSIEAGKKIFSDASKNKSGKNFAEGE
jgi:hypothetical protein